MEYLINRQYEQINYLDSLAVVFIALSVYGNICMCDEGAESMEKHSDTPNLFENIFA